jgi:hypothetical protein
MTGLRAFPTDRMINIKILPIWRMKASLDGSGA